MTFSTLATQVPEDEVLGCARLRRTGEVVMPTELVVERPEQPEAAKELQAREGVRRSPLKPPEHRVKQFAEPQQRLLGRGEL